MTADSKASKNGGPIIEPALERPLLNLHAALDVGSFWKALQHLVSIAIPNRGIGLSLEPNPVLPMIARWTLSMPRGFFASEPIRSYLEARPRKKILRVRSLFANRGLLTKSALYRKYMAPHRVAHAVCILFWKGNRRTGGITILRTAAQGDLSPAEVKLLQQLYPQILTALRRLRSVGRERAARTGFEECLRHLPVPTILLRWNLKLVYQNKAARDFCAVWEKGPAQARLTKASSEIPSEILERCQLLKQRWLHARRSRWPRRAFKQEQVRHPRSPNLRASVRLKPLSKADLARPHFVIECEDLRGSAHVGNSAAATGCLVQLTSREQEITKFVCEGRSNQEIADEVGLSLPTVKKHLHTIFRKLEVTSRSRLIALMR